MLINVALFIRQQTIVFKYSKHLQYFLQKKRFFKSSMPKKINSSFQEILQFDKDSIISTTIDKDLIKIKYFFKNFNKIINYNFIYHLFESEIQFFLFQTKKPIP